MRWSLLSWLVGVLGAAYVVRTAVVLGTRRRLPAVAAFTDRWWRWAPFAAALVFIVWINPWLGLLAVPASLLGLYYGSPLGSPFRPRR